MKLLSVLCSAILMTSCSFVTVRQIAGDKVPELEHSPEGKWIGEDGMECSIKLKDKAKAIYELRSTNKEEPNKFQFAIRSLKERLVVTIVDENGRIADDSSPFFRAVITEGTIVLFSPEQERFHEAVRSKRIAGHHTPASNQPDKIGIASSVLDKFTSAEVDAMDLPQKGNVLGCFKPDPSAVLIRMTARKKAR